MKANKTAQATISAGRALLLLAIIIIALGALMAEPDDNSRWWIEQFMISKAIAAAGFLTFWRLHSRWSRTDRWLKALNDYFDRKEACL